MSTITSFYTKVITHLDCQGMSRSFPAHFPLISLLFPSHQALIVGQCKGFTLIRAQDCFSTCCHWKCDYILSRPLYFWITSVYFCLSLKLLFVGGGGGSFVVLFKSQTWYGKVYIRVTLFTYNLFPPRSKYSRSFPRQAFYLYDLSLR